MIRKLRNIMLTMLAVMLSSCINDEERCAPEGLAQRISFKLALESPTSGSRASWGEEYEGEKGVSFDNYIDVATMRAVVTDLNNNILGEVANVLTWKEADGSYRFLGEITHLKLEKDADYRVMVIANSNVPAQTAITGNIRYNASFLKTAIPMWGVRKITFRQVDNQDLGVIYMLRAAAKVEVVLTADVAQTYSLNSVTMRNTRDAGLVFPYGWTSATGTADLPAGNPRIDEANGIYAGEGIDQENCINEIGSLTTDNLPFTIEGNKATIYIPEYSNAAWKDTNPALISVALGAEGNNVLLFEDALRFATYSGGVAVPGSEYDIVRNHIYRFNITAVAGGGLEVVYMVADWIDGDVYERHELDYPTYHNPVVCDCYDRSSHQFDETHVFDPPIMAYDPNTTTDNGAFSCWFKMSGPEGKEWQPTLYGAEADYVIKVYKGDSYSVESEPTDELVADPDVWYNIRVIPLSDDNIGHSVKFGITYDNTAMLGTSEFLFVNGTAGKIVWPNSGADPKLIEIKQVSLEEFNDSKNTY